MKIIWLSRAEHDLDSIVEYIAADDPDAAIDQGEEIIEQILGLERFPEKGRCGRVDGTFELVVVRTPYIVAYRIKEGRIQVLRILHSSQPWPTSF
jgi:addiction module RelE/StbE family toxin